MKHIDLTAPKTKTVDNPTEISVPELYPDRLEVFRDVSGYGARLTYEGKTAGGARTGIAVRGPKRSLSDVPGAAAALQTIVDAIVVLDAATEGDTHGTPDE